MPAEGIPTGRQGTGLSSPVSLDSLIYDADDQFTFNFSTNGPVDWTPTCTAPDGGGYTLVFYSHENYEYQVSDKTPQQSGLAHTCLWLHHDPKDTMMTSAHAAHAQSGERTQDSH